MKPSHILRAIGSYARIFPFFLIAGTLLTATNAIAAPGSVNAQAIKFTSGQYKLRNACNGKLVDVESIPSPWSRVQQRSEGARVGQAWEVSEQANGTYRLIVPGSNSALQTSYGATTQGTSIDMALGELPEPALAVTGCGQRQCQTRFVIGAQYGAGHKIHQLGGKCGCVALPR